ncbi:hypothetical protein SAMN05216296_2808 [Pseudomonas pohangensis]|uniref:Secreted protein n=1 Tax=Pseudomonas pohangensis TaxID=364197 RepID=A0A1H2H7L8_9PSED|nr:co-regulatory protein PtrA N-terminal domain-containing protein [Pseudomonas pohangensis]SDU27806.1 hypothetical protein SAMN05216296_2808 [Pseudomonas pohangensis]
MKAIQALFVVAALSVSSIALAEGGSDRVSARMEQLRDASQAAAQLASQQKAEAPVAVSHDKQPGHANC